MSEIREKLLGSSALRSRAIKVVALSIILISAFAFSTAFISLIFGSQRFTPSKNLENVDYTTVDLIPIDFPWDLQDFLDFLDNLGLELDPEDLDALMDMFDGVPDGLDLTQFAGLLLAALFSEVEVFRVYDYDVAISEMEDLLWKYECFDEYNDGSWETSLPPDNYDFYSYTDKAINYPEPAYDLLKIKLLSNMTPSVGEQNTFTAPSLFSSPFIMEGSVDAPYLVPSSPILRKQPGVVSVIEDGLNSTAIIAEFTSSAGTNVSYELFGLPLKQESVINSSAISPNSIIIITDPDDPNYSGYPNLKNHYIDIFDRGGTIGNFINNNDYFRFHYNYLNDNVINAGDNAFMIADKIRIYLQLNFNLTYNPTPDTEDPIDYFCQTQGGLYSEFASAFCAFTRAFGVASRFVDGFNSKEIEQVFDNVEGTNCFAVKYRNMYNWAEIFVPTDIYGNGEWVQMDVLNNLPPIYSNDTYTLSVSTPFEDTPVDRTLPVTITATLLNNSQPFEGETIYFTDTTTGTDIGSNVTNAAGKAFITVNVDDTYVVGPHVIKAVYTPMVANVSHYIVKGNISVTIESVSKTEVNISGTDRNIQVQGYVYDPIADQNVKYSYLNFVLLVNGTNNVVPFALTPFYTTTDENGDFDVTLEVSQSISPGPMELRADFNGTWIYMITHLGMDYPYPLNPINDTSGFITNSSNRMFLNVTKDKSYNLTLFINNIVPNNRDAPVVSRSDILTLKAVVLNETDQPMSGEVVRFYNYTGDPVDPIYIRNATTDANGEANITIIPGYNALSGPNLLYAQIGGEQNYSYYILNEEPTLTIISGPNPLVINKSNPDNDDFYIVGYLNDSINSQPLSNCDVTLRMFNGGIDYTSNLTGPGPNPFQTDANGKFNVSFRVHASTPPGNYTLRLDFNGSYDLTGYPYHGSNIFNLQYINTSTQFTNDLQVTYLAPFIFNYVINGIPKGQIPYATVTRNGNLNLTVSLMLGATPLIGYNVSFYDVTNNSFLGSNITNALGYATCIYNPTALTVAGPHLTYAYVDFYNKYNYSYYILNAPINITVDVCPQPYKVNNTGSLGRSFYIHGYMIDGTNGAPIPYGTVEILFVGEPTSYLTPIGGSQQHDNYFDCNNTGEIYALFEVADGISSKNYTIRVDCNGTFTYTNPAYPNLFNLISYSNFSYAALGLQDLKVQDPNNITILFQVNGTHVPLIYPSGSLPPVVYLGENITINGRVFQYGAPVADGDVHLYDVYNSNNEIATVSVDGSGYYTIELNTSLENLHAGLHHLKVMWKSYDTFNSTYIIINQTIDGFGAPSLSNNAIIRGVNGVFTVSGYVLDDSIALRGLKVRIGLFNESMYNFTQYLVFEPGYSYTAIIDDSGYYEFQMTRIGINCPQGNYSIRIDFIGDIERTDGPITITMTDAIIGTNTSKVFLNVSAQVNVFEGTYSTDYLGLNPEEWIDGDTLYVTGTAQWDNGDPLRFVNMTLTVRFTNGTVIATNTTVQTDFFGSFTGILQVDTSFPLPVSQTVIVIDFNPLNNNLPYVEDPNEIIYND